MNEFIFLRLFTCTLDYRIVVGPFPKAKFLFDITNGTLMLLRIRCVY